jgi:hypothetical protein
MAYTSDESGRGEVYVRPFPGGEFQRQRFRLNMQRIAGVCETERPHV